MTFDPAPRDSRDDRDDVLDTAPALKKAVTAVTVVTLGERIQGQADTSPGVGAGVLIADMIVRGDA